MAGRRDLEKLDPRLVRVIVVVLLGTIMALLDTTIVSVANDALSRDFHVSVSTIQWVTTGYLLALAVVIPVTGWGVHRMGARPLYLLSLGLFTLGSVLCGCAWSAQSLIAFRVLQGLGGGMLLPVGQTILARAAGPKQLGRAMSLISVPAVLGPVLGPVIGGAIVTHSSWRWIFFVNVPIGAVAMVLALRGLPATERDRDHRFDLPGFLLLAPGLLLVVYGLAQVGEQGGFRSATVQISLLTGLALCAGFVWRSFKAPEPLIDLTLFRNRNFSVSAICIFLLGATLYGNMFLLPLYYQVVRGQSALVAGLMMAPQGIGAAFSARFAGLHTDRHGPQLIVPVGLGLLTLGTLAYTQVSATSSFWLLGVALFVRGIGLGLAMLPLSAASYRGLQHDEIPRATAAANIMRQVGGSIGVAVFAVVLQNEIAAQLPHAPSFAGVVPHALPLAIANKLSAAFGAAFWWSCATCALAVLPTLLLRKGAVAESRTRAETLSRPER